MCCRDEAHIRILSATSEIFFPLPQVIVAELCSPPDLSKLTDDEQCLSDQRNLWAMSLLLFRCAFFGPGSPDFPFVKIEFLSRTLTHMIHSPVINSQANHFQHKFVALLNDFVQLSGLHRTMDSFHRPITSKSCKWLPHNRCVKIYESHLRFWNRNEPFLARFIIGYLLEMFSHHERQCSETCANTQLFFFPTTAYPGIRVNRWNRNFPNIPRAKLFPYFIFKSYYQKLDD